MELNSRIKQARGSLNQADFAKKIGVSPRTLGHYESGTRVPDAKTIENICVQTGVTPNWLILGDDTDQQKSRSPEPVSKRIDLLKSQLESALADNSKLLKEKGELAIQLLEKAIDPERDFVVPVIGLAECSLPGWEQISKKGLHAVAPVDIWKIKNSFGVIASSDSMSPAGIEPGHLVFCNPELDPEPGDAVYVEQDHNHATIKLYRGETGKRETLMLRLQGWQPKNEKRPGEHPKPFTMEMPKSAVKLLATVVYIKRRF